MCPVWRGKTRTLLVSPAASCSDWAGVGNGACLPQLLSDAATWTALSLSFFELPEHSYTLPWNRTLECFFLLVLPSYTRALHLGGLKYGHFGETGKGVSGAFVSNGNFSPEFQTFFFLIYQLSPVPHPGFPLTLVFVKSMFPNRLIKCTN